MNKIMREKQTHDEIGLVMVMPNLTLAQSWINGGAGFSATLMK